MGLRILTGLIGIPILLVFILMGGIILELGIGILMTFITLEFAKMMAIQGHQMNLPVVFLGEFIFLLTIWATLPHWASIGVVTTFVLLLANAIIKYPRINITDIAVNLFTLIYIGWTLSHIMLISNLENGSELLFFLFVCIWASDSGAYFVGCAIGKHKLAPILSPKKTIEGAIGGVVMAILIGIGLNLALGILPFIQGVVLAGFISVVGQLGDLVESMFKRLVGVKDSGNILPGHGGMLDRFDSVMFAAPIVYVILTFYAI